MYTKRVLAKKNGYSNHLIREIQSCFDSLKKLGFFISAKGTLYTLSKDKNEIELNKEEIMDLALMLDSFDPKTTRSYIQDQKKKAYIKIVGLSKEKHVQLTFVKFDEKTIFELDLDI